MLSRMVTAAPRPSVAFAMHPDLLPAVLDDAQRARLDGVADVIDPVPLSRFDDERAERVLAGCDVLLGHWGCPLLDAAALARAPRLRLLAYAGGTVRTIVSDALWERGVTVTTAAEANAVPVAEFTLASILLANKGALVARERLRGSELRVRRPRPVGNVGKRVGLIGASRVGRKVIALLAPFALEVVVADPLLTTAEAEALGVTLVDLPTLLRTCEIVSVHAPELPSTHHLVGAPELALVQDGATLINTARGSIVDTDALVAELASGRISAVLDVTDPEPLPGGHPLLSLPNAFVTPHVAGALGSELSRLTDAALEEIERHAAGLPPLDEVRRPDMDRIA
jgi:phosphoglycerate dehydrogenase-like enzyme